MYLHYPFGCIRQTACTICKLFFLQRPQCSITELIWRVYNIRVASRLKNEEKMKKKKKKTKKRVQIINIRIKTEPSTSAADGRVCAWSFGSHGVRLNTYSEKAFIFRTRTIASIVELNIIILRKIAKFKRARQGIFCTQHTCTQSYRGPTGEIYFTREHSFGARPFDQREPNPHSTITWRGETCIPNNPWVI